MRQNLCKPSRKLWPLISAVGKQRLQKRKHAKNCRHVENASVAILNVGWMNDGVEQQAYCIDEPLLGAHPTSAVLSEAWYFAKRVTLSLALRSSGDAGRGFGRVGATTALVAG